MTNNKLNNLNNLWSKQSMRSDILTPNEVINIKSMATYWNEVSKRDDTTPLYSELQMITNRLGPKILFIISEYVNEIDETN